MGKAMMGTGEASGDNRAIEAAEQAIANPLLDGVSMQGAKGVIISITGGEDMRLMEVDEAANHIRELVDPDANIIWGSAFNNDLEGKIRVSVVATGIEADAANMPAPAKVFSFPNTRAAAAPMVRPSEPTANVQTAAKAVAASDDAAVNAPEPETMAEAPAAADTGPLQAKTEDATRQNTSDDELMLNTDNILTSPVSGNPLAPPEDDFMDADVTPPAPGNRSWAAAEPEPARPKIAREGATLFERMSSIARGAAKANVEESKVPAMDRDPLDIPRFLNRQNNQ